MKCALLLNLLITRLGSLRRTTDIPLLAHEDKIWDVICESKIWSFYLLSIVVIAVLHAMPFCSCELDPMKCNFVEIWINIWITSFTKISCGFYISGEGMLVHCSVCWHFTVDIRLHYRLGNTRQCSIKTMNAPNNTRAIFWIQQSCVSHVNIISIMSLEASCFIWSHYLDHN